MKRSHLTFSTLPLMLVALLTGCGGDSANQAQEQQGVPVRVEKAQTREITEWEEFTGRFRASQRVEIRSRVSGYLDEVKFTDGQIVKKGDTLFIIDQRPFKIALEGAKARFDLAEKEYARAQKLRNLKAISEEDYDQRLQEMRIAKTTLEDAELNLEFTEVRAPFTGHISRNLVDKGSLISGGSANATLLTTLVAKDPIEFYFEGSESDLLRYLRARDAGEVATDASRTIPVYVKLQDEKDFNHAGVINFLDNEIDENSGSIEVRAVFENKDKLFEPGMFGRLRLAMSRPQERLLIQPQIIGTEQTRKYVYTLDENNKAVRTYVDLGDITEDNLRVIRSGLSKEARIVVGGLHMVRPGVLIAPIENTSTEKAAK